LPLPTGAWEGLCVGGCAVRGARSYHSTPTTWLARTAQPPEEIQGGLYVLSWRDEGVGGACCEYPWPYQTTVVGQETVVPPVQCVTGGCRTHVCYFPPCFDRSFCQRTPDLVHQSGKNLGVVGGGSRVMQNGNFGASPPPPPPPPPGSWGGGPGGAQTRFLPK